MEGRENRSGQIIDAHRTGIPDEGERTDEDRAWLLALHRMDMRNYEPEASMPSSEDGGAENGGEHGRTISFKSKGIAADLQGFVEAGAEERDRFFAGAQLVNWNLGLRQWEQPSEKWGSVCLADCSQTS